MAASVEAGQKNADFDRLLWVLRHGRGFGLYFAACNSIAYRTGFVETLKAEYGHPIVEIDLSGHGGEDYIDQVLLNALADAPADAPVFVYGLETLLPSRDEDLQFRTIQELNWRRNLYSQINRNLVIWLPDYALTLLARQAPDFYDWHSGVFEFAVPESEKLGLIRQSLSTLDGGPVQAVDHLSLKDKQQWIGALNGLLDETPKNTIEYGKILDHLGSFHYSFGRYHEAFKYYKKSLDQFQKLDAKIYEGQELNNIAQVLFVLSNQDDALKYAEAALKVFQETDNPSGAGNVLNLISNIYFNQYNYPLAMDACQQALVSFGSVKDGDGRGATLNNIAIILLNRREYSKSFKKANQALHIFQGNGNKRGQGVTFSTIGTIYYSTGELENAKNAFEQALLIERDLGYRYGLCPTLFNLGSIHRQQGNLAAANRAWLEVYQIAKQDGDVEALQALDKLAKDLGEAGLSYWENLHR